MCGLTILATFLGINQHKTEQINKSNPFSLLYRLYIGDSSYVCVNMQGIIGTFGSVKSYPAIVDRPSKIIVLLVCSLATEMEAGNVDTFVCRLDQ